MVIKTQDLREAVNRHLTPTRAAIAVVTVLGLAIIAKMLWNGRRVSYIQNPSTQITPIPNSSNSNLNSGSSSSSSTSRSCSAVTVKNIVVTVENIVTTLQEMFPAYLHREDKFSDRYEAIVTEFLNRGGKIQVWREGTPIPLDKSESYIIGCASGVNRSQAHAAYMRKQGYTIKGILAGGDSAFNDKMGLPSCSQLYFWDSERTAFQTVFGSDKQDQIGKTEANPPDGLEWNDQTNWFAENKDRCYAFYTDYVKNLGPTHFIAYAASGPNVLQRLIQREGSLEGFTVTLVPWLDEIAHPPAGIERLSAEAYRAFLEKIKQNFPIVGSPT